MATIASLVVQIGADVAELRTGVDTANAKIESFSQKATGMFNALKGAAIFAVVADGVRRMADAADEIDGISAKIGDTAVNVQRLQAISEQFDVELGSVVGAIQEMEQRLANGKIDEALQKLNIDVRDFAAMSPAEKYVAAAEALANVTDKSEKVALAQELMGKKWKENAGAMREGVGEAGRWVSMSEETVGSIDAISTALKNATASAVNFLANFLTSGGGTNTIADFLDRAFGNLPQQLEKVKGSAGAGFLVPALPPGLPADYESISDSLGKAATSSAKLQTEQAKTEIAARRAADAFRESVGYFNTADNIGTSFRQSVEDSADEIAAIRQSMEAVAGISFNTTWVQFQAGVADSSREVEALRARMQKLASWADIGQRLSGAIIGALQGGGSVGKALGGEVGQMLGTKLGTSIGDWAGRNLGGALGSAIGGAAGSVLPVVGTMLGSLAGSAIGKLFGGGEGKQVNDLRDKFVSASGGIHELNVKAQEAGLSLDRLLNAKKVSDFEAAVNELNAALAEQDQMHQRGIAAMEKYGITIDQAGQKFKQNQMNATAEDLVKDFTALVSIGVDVDTIIEKMGASVGDFVHRSIEMGTSVPREMEPIIRRMIETGALVDKNGEKFTDLGQIPFADSLNEGMAELIAKLDTLLTQIGVHLPRVIRDLPDGDFTITGNINAPGLPDVPQLATGGVVRKPTLALIGEAGPEAVVPLSRFGQMSSGASKSGGETHVHIHGGVFDGYSSEQTFARRVLDVLSQEKERRGRSLAFAGA